MKASELQKILRPLVQEVVKEVLLEESGIMSKLISEVCVGLQQNAAVFNEARAIPTAASVPSHDSQKIAEHMKRERSLRNNIAVATGMEGIFDDVAPMDSPPEPGSTSAPSAFAQADWYRGPDDPGAPLEFFKGSNAWAELAKKG